MAGRFDLVVSPHLLYELQTVLAREKFRRYLTYEEATEYVSWLHHEAEVPEEPAGGIMVSATPDPDDDYLVTLSTQSGVSCLVSGDRHLLGLPDRLVRDGEGHALTHILTPREFLEELERSV